MAGLLWRAGLPCVGVRSGPDNYDRVLNEKLDRLTGAASQPNAGQACSPQEASFHTGAALAWGTWVEPVGGFGLLFSSMAGDSNGCFQVVARANDRMYLRP